MSSADPEKRRASEASRPQKDRTGPGVTAGVGLTPEQIERRLDNLRRGHKTVADKREALAALAVEVAGMDLEAVRRHITPRLLTVACYHLAGSDNHQIARLIGYASADVVRRALLRPEVRRVVELVKQAQLQKVIDGEFGVQAQAKAAAPKVTRRMIEKAGAVEGRDGTPVGMAARDADAIRAGETVLRISGDLVERRQDVHMHLLGQLDDGELRRFSEEGVWPDRYAHVLATLEGPRDPVDVTPAEPPPTRSHHKGHY